MRDPVVRGWEVKVKSVTVKRFTDGSAIIGISHGFGDSLSTALEADEADELFSAIARFVKGADDDL